MTAPVEPPSTSVAFPDPRAFARREMLAMGGDFRPGTLLSAYRRGIFPWPQADGVGWFSPLRRAIFPLDVEPQWARSLRRAIRKHSYRVSRNEAFAGVMTACTERRPDGTWITTELAAGYIALHELGWAHSLELWEDRELVGGIYGVAVGKAFCAESMFHRRTDASKIAFAELVTKLREAGYELFDAQVMSAHLASLGCIEIERREYLARLERALTGTPREI